MFVDQHRHRLVQSRDQLRGRRTSWWNQRNTEPEPAGCPLPIQPGLMTSVTILLWNLVSGGNPELEAEKADSWTIGTVVTPSFLPGFSLSVDYYNIKVKNVITAPTPQAIVNAATTCRI